MKYLLFIFIFFTAITFSKTKADVKSKTDQCFVCHKDLGDTPAALFVNDVHYKNGLSCASCHGGLSTSDDMDIAMDKKNGFIGVPHGDDVSRRCAKCHSDSTKMKSYGSKIATGQYENLKLSVHGAPSIDGKERILQCTTCHNAHGIKDVNDKTAPVNPVNIPKLCSKCHSNAVYMRQYNPALAVDQLQKYRSSVHGKLNLKGDPKPAECVSCHGNHDIQAVNDVRSKVYKTNIPMTCAKCHDDADYMKQYKIKTNQYAEYSKSVHGIALLKHHDTGSPACND